MTDTKNPAVAGFYLSGILELNSLLSPCLLAAGITAVLLIAAVRQEGLLALQALFEDHRYHPHKKMPALWRAEFLLFYWNASTGP